MNTALASSVQVVSRVLLNKLWLIAILAVLAVQYFGISLPGASVASVFQFSDAGNWLSCSFSFPQGDDWTRNWCMRRPLSFILLSPIAATASWGAAVPIFINALIAVAAAQQLINQARLFDLNPWVTFLGSGILMGTGVFYGLLMGPEALAFALSCISVVAIIKTFNGAQKGLFWPTIGCVAIVSSFLIRPGNPLLSLAVLVVLMSFLLSTRRYLGAVIGGLGIGSLVWGLPAVLRIGLGLKDAAHGSNAWSTIYPLVSDRADNWPDVYRIFSESATGVRRDTVAWGDLVREASIKAFWDDPFYGLDSFFQNIMWILNSGWLNMAIPVVPSSPQWQLFSTNSPSTIRAPSDTFWSQQGVLSMAVLPLSIVLWAASWLTVVLVVVWLLKIARSWPADNKSPVRSFDERLKSSVPGILGTSTVLGLLVLFGLVGHDEEMRHLVQSLPFAVFALYPALFSRPTDVLRSQPGESLSPLRAQGFLNFAIASLLVLAVVVPSGLQPKPSLVLQGHCDEPNSATAFFSVVGGKSRIGDTETAWGYGSTREAFSGLRPGVLLIAIPTEKAQIERFYLLTDDEALKVWAVEDQQVLLVCEVSDGPPALTKLGLRGLKPLVAAAP